MPRETRSTIHRPDECAVILTVCRPIAGRLYGPSAAPDNQIDSHRPGIAEQIMLEQAQLFCIDLMCYSISTTDIRQILKSRPDLAQSLSPSQVAERWLRLCPTLRTSSVAPEPPTTAEIQSITRSRKRVRNIRRQLSDISWWMRLLCQKLAQRLNGEDGLDGPFHRGRFRSVKLPGDPAEYSDLTRIDLSALPLNSSNQLTPAALRALAVEIVAHSPLKTPATAVKHQPPPRRSSDHPSQVPAPLAAKATSESKIRLRLRIAGWAFKPPVSCRPRASQRFFVSRPASPLQGPVVHSGIPP
jgi:hypothetical protein